MTNKFGDMFAAFAGAAMAPIFGGPARKEMVSLPREPGVAKRRAKRLQQKAGRMAARPDKKRKPRKKS